MIFCIQEKLKTSPERARLHFSRDAKKSEGDGVMPRITTASDAKKWRKIIGEDNYSAMLRALEDDALVWCFTNEADITLDSELTRKEKRKVLKIFREEKLGYAGWVRKTYSRTVPGFYLREFESH